MEDPIQKLLAGVGWGGLEEKPPNAEEEEQRAFARYEAAHAIAAPFMTPAGRQSLAKLKDMTTDKPSWPAEGRGGFYDTAMYGFVREGQNSVIRHIENMIAIAQAGPPVVQKAAKKNPKKSGIPTD